MQKKKKKKLSLACTNTHGIVKAIPTEQNVQKQDSFPSSKTAFSYINKHTKNCLLPLCLLCSTMCKQNEFIFGGL